MQFKSAISTKSSAESAVCEVCDAVDGVQPDLALLFVSPHFEADCQQIVTGILEATNARNLIGCTGESIIGPVSEVEHAPAIALWTAKLPDVRVLPFLIDLEDVKNFDDLNAWRDRIGAAPDDRPGLIILPEPFTFGPAVEHSLEVLDYAYPGGTVVGGMASGAESPGQNRLFMGDQILRQGMVGVSLSGPVAIDAVVSQGCRPVGEPLVITKAEQNVIQELRGRPAIKVVEELFRSASPRDQTLIREGLHVGTVVDENRREFKPGDFLIRNFMGVVERTGIAITALVRPGQTVQFHVRDRESADEEMKTLVARKLGSMPSPPTGGLLFTCNGRGTRLFEKPNHDIGVVNELAPLCSIAGFFAGGEIGPIGDKTFVHGFTSSLILLREAE